MTVRSGLGAQNDQGQLGIGAGTDQNKPVQVSGLSNVATIAGGYKHTAVVTSDGTVWTWGANDYGQLGDGTNVSKDSPIKLYF